MKNDSMPTLWILIAFRLKVEIFILQKINKQKKNKNPQEGELRKNGGAARGEGFCICFLAAEPFLRRKAFTSQKFIVSKKVTHGNKSGSKNVRNLKEWLLNTIKKGVILKVILL